MKIAIVGCGAVGSFYGARLCRTGAEVHFLLRSDYDAVRANGVQIESVDGDFQVRPHVARDPGAIGECDWVFVALKTTANDQLPVLIPPLVGPRTRLVTLQNGLGNEDRLAALAGEGRVLGGLCFVCLNRAAPGLVRHSAHGLVVLGEHRRPAGEAAQELAALLAASGTATRIAPDLEQAHWEKLVWNVPFNGLGVAGVAGFEAVMRGRLTTGPVRSATLPTDELLQDPHWAGLVDELMREVIRAGRGRGLELPDRLAEENLQRTRCMASYKASTLLDFERGLPLERESLFEEPRRQAVASGVSVPRLAALCGLLEQLDQVRTPARSICR
jgi:2-dehydropantoate 2-reductase